ncbi:MAG: glucose-1-phosphate adenylyltransferase, partial [Clostridiales bacterium]|nr:glucose-1-phosphate adenylyltransferase [Clostridiales bacterium]
MLPKQEIVAMLLAGGQGSRLGVLTKNMAKPAVPYGGKYRIIDFPLSNCVNSGIDTVGVLTQYQPLELNEYIGSGQPWDLDSMNGAGVHVLPPFQGNQRSDWYKGTANAIFQNIPFIERYHPEYVIVLSGDHIYKMDYSKMLAYHKEKGADCTISVIEVPWEEAPRFGILNTNDGGAIYEFDEKPKQPKSNKASMGIYIFNWDILKKYLTEDEADPNSENDFGNNIIPNLLRDKRKMYAYHFSGYWKDVGTISSLWEANMEVLDPEHSGIDLFDEDWKTDLGYMIKRDRHRPSVALWSVGNEVDCQGSGFMLDILHMLVCEVKHLDGERAVTCALSPHYADDSKQEWMAVPERLDAIERIAKEVDVLALNYQEQWYELIH